MNDKILITCSEDINLLLKSIGPEDLENLRCWKNEHRESFFFKGIITSEDQKKWFMSYLERNNDYMFIIQHTNIPIGCIGFRCLDDRIDFYNLILADKMYQSKGYMSNALRIAVQEAKNRYPNHPIMVSVLKSNPALSWYKRRGFTIVKEHENFFELILHLELIKSC